MGGQASHEPTAAVAEGLFSPRVAYGRNHHAGHRHSSSTRPTALPFTRPTSISCTSCERMVQRLLVFVSLIVLIIAVLLASPWTEDMLRSSLAAALASSSRRRPTPASILSARAFSASSPTMALDLPPFPPTRRDEDKVLVFQSKKDGRVELKDRACLDRVLWTRDLRSCWQRQADYFAICGPALQPITG